jgi:hypothetical protein
MEHNLNNAETELAEMVRARSDALIRGDAQRMNEILADEFTYTNASGQPITKSEYVESYVGSPDVKWLAQDMSDLQIQMYGDTGVVACRVHDRAIFHRTDFEGTFRSLFVYVKRDGMWRCVAGQTTQIKEL